MSISFQFVLLYFNNVTNASHLELEYLKPIPGLANTCAKSK